VTPIPVSDDYPQDPPAPNWVELPVPPVLANGVLVTAHLGSRSLAATVPVRAARREYRLQLVAAGLCGAVAALLILRAVDRRG
jgi:hypothetical protein